MPKSMAWSELLRSDRYSSDHTRIAPSVHPASNVSVFVEDIERILYSSPFRRLQGKTQVHPLPNFDYLRNRLTHTIEVAHVGRIIATECAKICTEKGEAEFNPATAGDVVYAACLAHDLGNPPFGHIGEYAIQTWFQRRKEDINLEEILSNNDLMNDLLHFDGNAQGFRILTRLAGWRMSGGLQLSYSTLGAFSKYPYGSKESTGQKKKFGFMHDDEEAAIKVFDGLGMMKRKQGVYSRHPLAFIVEAADDICYLTTDIEDSFRVGLLVFLSAETLLKEIGEMGHRLPRYAELNNADSQDRIAYLRAGAVSALIDAAISEFCNNSKEILSGRFERSLLQSSKYNTSLQEIRKTCDNTIYREGRKLQIEAAGYNVIMTLMDLFGGMIDQLLTKGLDDLDMRNDGLFQIMPREFRERLHRGDPYRSFLVLVDYISGMTDRFALDTFQRLTGSSVALGRMT